VNGQSAGNQMAILYGLKASGATMHVLSWTLLGLFVGLGPLAKVDEPNAATALINRAIQAQGGLENLAKTQNMIRKATGTVLFFGQEVPFTDETIVQLPNRWRWTFEGGPAQGEKTRYTMTYNGDKAWQKAAEATTEAPKERLQEIREQVYCLWIATLVPFKTEKGFTFIVLADRKVNGQDAAAILVLRQGQNDLTLCFDKTSGLLVNIQRKAKEAGIPTDKEYFYSDYRSVNGVRLPTKYIEHSNGKKVVDVSSISYQFLSHVDASLFGKP
jgi:hypothetical protein